MTTTVINHAWSYSQLKNYETCAKRYYHYNVAKDVVEPEGQQLLDGHRLHAAFDARIAKGAKLPLGMGMYEGMLAKFVAAPGETYSEQKLAITADFKPVGFFGKGVWLRTVIDACKITPDGTRASIVDWKDGKVKEDPTQLALMAAVMFVHAPAVQTVRSALFFVNHTQTLPAEYTREDQAEIWGEILPRVRKMARARAEQEFPPKPSGLCKKYCAVVSCPYHGR
jgi:PD-(D/E)XK nuclease superfamily